MRNQKQDASKQQYFQTQKTFSLQCGMHSINNLFKSPVYTIKDMEQICYNLSNDFINPHKHCIGGDYDANVIIIGLQNKKYECQWIDKRKKLKIQQLLNNKQRQTLGFLMNIEMPKKFYHSLFRFSSRHWLSIRPYGNNNQFALCDSNQTNYVKYSLQGLEKYIKEKMQRQNAELIWVFRRKQS